MASGPHTFITASIFSPERYQGNPLAIVSVRGNAINQKRKALIAKEFGYSETVFIHDSPGPNIPRRIEIYTEEGKEVSFAGHPVIGVAHYIFSWCEKYSDDTRKTAVIMTKAGPVPIFYNSYRQVAACSVPHNIHFHEKRLSMEKVMSLQPQLKIIPTIEKCDGKTFPVVSIVKGMTFGLVDLTETPEVLGGLKPSPSPEVELDEEWNEGLVGCLYYKRKDDIKQESEPTIYQIQARMISHGIEDPGTGSACSALACYLALNDKTDESKKDDENKEAVLDAAKDSGSSQRFVYAIQQGVEMGRLCTIAVEVDLKREKEGNKIANVTLSGRANFFTKGELIGI